jgi:hypothetical protein
MLPVAQRRCLGINFALLVADVRVAQHSDSLGIGGHDAILDAVMNHLHKVTGTIRAAMQIVVFGGASIFRTALLVLIEASKRSVPAASKLKPTPSRGYAAHLSVNFVGPTLDTP